MCSDVPMPMHAPSEPFLGGGVKTAWLHVLPFCVFFSSCTHKNRRDDGEKQIEQQLGIIMGLIWDGARLIENERRRTTEEKEKWSRKSTFPS